MTTIVDTDPDDQPAPVFRQAVADALSSTRAVGLMLVALFAAATVLALLVVAVWRPDGFGLAVVVAGLAWAVMVGEAKGKGWGE